MAAHNEKVHAAHEAETFQNYLELLVSLHKDCGANWDWQAYESAQPPEAPSRGNRNEQLAAQALARYVPGFFDKLFGGAKTRSAELEVSVVRAQVADQEVHDAALRAHHDEYELWKWRRALAARIRSGDASAYTIALNHAGAFEDVAAFKAKASVACAESDVVEIACLLSDEETVPTEDVKLTATGKLTSKAMPAGRYWALYQDYVCSAALRIANETFAVLPIERTIVNVGAVLTNPSTGHREPVIFLAVHFARSALRGLNLDAIDPSDSMSNFPHRMKFKKTTGFESVLPITPQEQWISM